MSGDVLQSGRLYLLVSKSVKSGTVVSGDRHDPFFMLDLRITRRAGHHTLLPAFLCGNSFLRALRTSAFLSCTRCIR